MHGLREILVVKIGGINLLEESGLPFDITYGYRTIARELIDRIETHPNRVDGWV